MDLTIHAELMSDKEANAASAQASKRTCQADQKTWFYMFLDSRCFYMFLHDSAIKSLLVSEVRVCVQRFPAIPGMARNN